MPKMTRRLVIRLLSGDYMDALAYFANKALHIAEKQEKDLEEALWQIDEKVWPIAEDEDLSEEWLRVYSALMCGT